MQPAEFPVGVPVQVAEHVRRITAPNASPFTGPGTNTFLLGDPAWAIVDPGPDIDSHLDALVRAAPAARWCFVTHTHRDHSPLAARYCAATGAAAVGLPPPAGLGQDPSFVPQQQPARDLRYAGPQGLSLRAIDTPGHASNHVCYLLEPQALLFSGDHILDGVSPVILAPDGDMRAYLESLRRLKAYAIQAIAPAHGRLLTRPVDVIDGLIAHRLEREAQVLLELRTLGVTSIEALLAIVYRGLQPALSGLARCTLEAHLIKLQHDGLAEQRGELWHAR